MEINGFEARGLTSDIIEYLEKHCSFQSDSDTVSDLRKLLRSHDGLAWNDIDKHWFASRQPDEPLEFDDLTLQCYPEVEGRIKAQ